MRAGARAAQDACARRGPGRRRRLAAALALAALTAGCGLVDAARQTRVAELVGLGIDQPCVIDRFEVGALAGGYLRRSGQSARFDIFHVRGTASGRDLPRRLTFDDRSIRRLAPEADSAATLTGGRASMAEPIAALALSDTPPLAYTLRYRQGETTFAGPLTVGRVPAPAALPTTGTTRYTGRAVVEAELAGTDGTVRRIGADGVATLAVGWGSGQARLSLRDLAAQDGAEAALPFTTVDWARLGLCGARIVSTGQGTFRMIDAEARRVRPLAGPDGDGPPARATVEGALFAADDPARPPATAGGVFLIQGDGGVLRGAFTVRSP